MNSLVIIALFFFSQIVNADEVYRRVLTYFPDSLNVSKLQFGNSTQVLIQVSEGLVRYEKDIIVSGLAEKFSVSRDGKVYSFFLRKGLRFSDGSPITAKDVVKSLEFVLAPESTVWEDLSFIQGATEFHHGKASSISGIKVRDSLSVEIQLQRAFSPFLSILASDNFSIYSEKAIESMKKQKFEGMPSSGPFVIERWVDQEKIVLKKNPLYYLAESVFFDSIVYTVVKKEDEALKGFEQNLYDDIWPYEIQKSANFDKLKLAKVPALTGYSWVVKFNLNEMPFEDIKFRQFIFQNLNVEGFLAELDLPKYYQADGVIPRGLPGYSPKQSLSEAERIRIDQLNCSESKPCAFEILYFKKPKREEALTKLIAPLKKYSKKINVTIKGTEFAEFNRTYKDSKFQSLYVGLDCPGNDTYLFLRQFLVGDRPPGFDSRPLMNQLNEALNINSLKKRQSIFQDVDRTLRSQLPVLPIYHGDRPFRYVKSDIEGYHLPLKGFTSMKLMGLRRKVKK